MQQILLTAAMNGMSRTDGVKRYRGARIRTEDLGHPKAARYQAAPHPDRVSLE
jgi:hypothetical protein